MKLFITLSVLFGWAFLSISGEHLSVEFDYPAFKGDFYVSGVVSFPPSTVISEDNIAVYDQTNKEIPSKITVKERWPDSSLLEVEILFPANVERQKSYTVSYGSDVKRKRKFTQTAVLPTIGATIGKTPQTKETIDMPVGELIVKVDRSSDIRYYWYVIPLGLLIFLSLYRAVRNT